MTTVHEGQSTGDQQHSGLVRGATAHAASGPEHVELPTAYDAILLASFGGPEGQDDVIPFLRNVTRGRGIPDERLEEVAKHYRHFGGVSPINDQNRELKAALEAELDRRHIDLPVLWGNRNWAPYLDEALVEANERGFTQLIAIGTSAYSSYSSCRQYREDYARALADTGLEGTIRIDKVRQFFDHPGFIQPFIEGLHDGLARVADAGIPRDSTHVLFTTHSIPSSDADRSGPPERGFGAGGAYAAQHLAVAEVVIAAQGDVASPLVELAETGSRQARPLVELAETGSRQARSAEQADAASTEQADAASTEQADAASTEQAGAASTEQADAASTEQGDAASTEQGDAASTEQGDAASTEVAWSLVYQSRSGPPSQPWLEPDINDAIDELAEAGIRAVVIVPIGFVSDHMEVKWDLDTEAMETSERNDILAIRVPTPGVHAAYVSGLVDLVLERRDGLSKAERPSLTPLGPWYDVCRTGCCENVRLGFKPALAGLVP